MHGRLKVKTTQEQKEEQKIKDREKAYHFRHLKEKLFALRPTIPSADNHDDIFKLTTEILLINPDFYTVWNIRREALLVHVDKNPDRVDTIWNEELSFALDCLKKNEKSYSVWQHRIWILSKMPKSGYEKEILLCNSFLDKDERNFHCWDYRSYICDIAQRDIEQELEFTEAMIRKNFSNFSAWHRRHKLFLKGMSLPEDECPAKCNLKLQWHHEYSQILQALFTDPTDQSPWLYHNWLVKNNYGHLSQKELSELNKLHEIEPDNKWVKQALELANKHVVQPVVNT